jgi:hypothetical protein
MPEESRKITELLSQGNCRIFIKLIFNRHILSKRFNSVMTALWILYVLTSQKRNTQEEKAAAEVMRVWTKPRGTWYSSATSHTDLWFHRSYSISVK